MYSFPITRVFREGRFVTEKEEKEEKDPGPIRMISSCLQSDIQQMHLSLRVYASLEGSDGRLVVRLNKVNESSPISMDCSEFKLLMVTVWTYLYDLLPISFVL